MNSTLSKETNVIFQKGELERLLEAAAKAINLPDMNSTKPPRLMINYQRNLTGIPEGSWAFGQKLDETGKVVDPGMLVDNPKIIVMAVRYRYGFYSKETKKFYHSPMFKQFGNMARTYKQELINEVNDRTNETVTGDDIRTDQLVYAMVNISKEWKPCLANFHGSNYAVLNNYLKSFDKFPYCSFQTHLSNPTAFRNGAAIYYKVESITRDEKMFDSEFLRKVISDAQSLNIALDNSASVGDVPLSNQNAASSSRQSGLSSANGAGDGNGIKEEEIPF